MTGSDQHQGHDDDVDGGPFPPSIIYLLGPLAVGKFTVARAIAEINGAAVVDNQLINLPIFSLLTGWPDAEVTERMWREIDFVRDAVFRTIEEVAPRSMSYVLTNALEEEPDAYVLYERVKRIAARRGSIFLPVVLTCEREEQLRRIPDPSRTRRLKTDDCERAKVYLDNTTFFTPGEKDLLTIDTTTMSSRRAADLVLARLLRREVT